MNGIRQSQLGLTLKLLSEGRIKWFFDNLIKMALIKQSFHFKKPLCGPLVASVIVTYKCNFRCPFCDAYNKPALLELENKYFETEDFKKGLQQLIDFKVGVIGFTGGEPLLREDIFELITFAKQKGPVVHLSTNGSLLSEDRAELLLRTKIDGINISLDGAIAETNDFIRGKGSFEKVTENIRTLVASRKKLRSKTQIGLFCVLTRKNLNETQALISLAKKLGVDSAGFMPVQDIVYKHKDDYGNLKNELCPDAESEIDQAVDFLIEYKRKYGFIDDSKKYLELFKSSLRGYPLPLNCYMGHGFIVLDCYGNIFPCYPFALKGAHCVGNISTTPLRQVYHSSEYAKVRDMVKNCHSCYWNCTTELNVLLN